MLRGPAAYRELTRRRGRGCNLVDCFSFSDSTDAVLRVGIGPAEGPPGFVMGANVLHELAPQIGGGGEDPAGDAVALNLGKPQFDLIEPGAVRRRVVQRDPRMSGEPRLDGLGLVGREVVGDEMDRAALRLGGDEVVEEADKLAARVPGGGPPLR